MPFVYVGFGWSHGYSIPDPDDEHEDLASMYGELEQVPAGTMVIYSIYLDFEYQTTDHDGLTTISKTVSTPLVARNSDEEMTAIKDAESEISKAMVPLALTVGAAQGEIDAAFEEASADLFSDQLNQ